MTTKEENIKEGIEIIIELLREYYKNISDIDILFIAKQIKKGR